MRNRDKGNGLIIVQRMKGKNKDYITVPDLEPSPVPQELKCVSLLF